MVISNKRETVFWSRVDKSGSCWLWTGAKTKSGYGQFRLHGRLWIATRLSYALTFGDIPEGLVICHRCDNPQCVRPEHLFAGTYAENMQDMHQKERNRQPKGEEHGCAKLSDAQVVELRAKLTGRKGEITEMAKGIGITRKHLGQVLRGNSWRHLPGERRERRAGKKIEPEIAAAVVLSSTGARGEQYELAEKYGISQQSVSNILRSAKQQHGI